MVLRYLSARIHLEEAFINDETKMEYNWDRYTASASDCWLWRQAYCGSSKWCGARYFKCCKWCGESTPAPSDEPGNEVTSTPQPTADNSNTETQATAKPVADEKQKQSQSIDAYYTDSQVMDLIPAKTSISFSDDAQKYTETFKALQSNENTDLVPLWGKIELKSLKFVDGQIVMDLHKPDEAQLGAGGESLAISSLAKTYFQFEEVKSIEVLVDGEKVESLMGHVDLMHPMTRDNI